MKAPDEEPAQSSVTTWSVPTSAALAAQGTRRRRWITLAAAALLTVCSLYMAFVTVANLPLDRSADVPLPGNVRLGFFRMGGPTRWTCPDGHDHWSLPYWMGLGFTGIGAALLWGRFVRSSREPRR